MLQICVTAFTKLTLRSKSAGEGLNGMIWQSKFQVCGGLVKPCLTQQKTLIFDDSYTKIDNPEYCAMSNRPMHFH